MYGIRLSGVNLVFKPRKSWHLKDLFIRGMHAGDESDGRRAMHVLRDIDLDIGSGDRLGVIGHNGAGKSTLLRIIAGIYHPTSGRIKRSGKIVSLFELTTGFDGDSTGWDNIRIRGILLGMSPREVEEKIDGIAAFTGLGEHLNRPLKYYSSGMCLRLAFSVSTAIEPDILLLDEIVGAGDLDFAAKARQRLDRLIEKARILVFASHSFEAVRSMCNRCLWISHGRIAGIGEPAEMIGRYEGSGDRI